MGGRRTEARSQETETDSTEIFSRFVEPLSIKPGSSHQATQVSHKGKISRRTKYIGELREDKTWQEYHRRRQDKAQGEGRPSDQSHGGIWMVHRRRLGDGPQGELPTKQVRKQIVLGLLSSKADENDLEGDDKRHRRHNRADQKRHERGSTIRRHKRGAVRKDGQQMADESQGAAGGDSRRGLRVPQQAGNGGAHQGFSTST